jgi:glycosyltransferase involved in cell wall biosynthesis
MNLAYGKSPEVTVLMSCYNASRWLRMAIDSVLRQTFEKFEFILVDDGSTDDTWNIIQTYCEIDQRIVAIKKENTGLADSLNVGIAHAKGEWIARLDADDLCEPDRLAEQFNFVRKYQEVVLLGTGFLEFNEQGGVIKKQRYPSYHCALVRHLRGLQRFFPHSSAFFHREAALDAGGYNPLFRKAQDCDLWMRFAERGRIACLRDCLVRVRKHSDQITNSSGGPPQTVYSTAAVTCHFLRISGYPDPSSDRDEAAWKVFMEWVEKLMAEKGELDRLGTWGGARGAYFAKENRLRGAIHLGSLLLKSGSAGTLLREKLFGSSLPRSLALEWMKRSCAAS